MGQSKGQGQAVLARRAGAGGGHTRRARGILKEGDPQILQ